MFLQVPRRIKWQLQMRRSPQKTLVPVHENVFATFLSAYEYPFFCFSDASY